MVAYDEKTKLSQSDFIIAGAGSGFITRMLCQPLDVLKIRFQLQVEPISKNKHSKYHSLFHATNLIIREEGVKALWKGHIPAQFLSISYGIAQFWSFEVLNREMSYLKSDRKLNHLIHFSCGAVAGCAATLISFPFDVLRTRLVAQSEQAKVYSNFFHAIVTIPKQEGFLVLYRGLWPTFIQIGPHTGVSFMCYKLFENLYKFVMESNETTLYSSLFAGSLAGLCGKTAIYPLDLAKKRLQIQGFEQGRAGFGEAFKCQSFTDCLIRIYKVEGYSGYFKGLTPSVIKAVVTSALHFSSYEMICKLLIGRKN